VDEVLRSRDVEASIKIHSLAEAKRSRIAERPIPRRRCLEAGIEVLYPDIGDLGAVGAGAARANSNPHPIGVLLRPIRSVVLPHDRQISDLHSLPGTDLKRDIVFERRPDLRAEVLTTAYSRPDQRQRELPLRRIVWCASHATRIRWNGPRCRTGR